MAIQVLGDRERIAWCGFGMVWHWTVLAYQGWVFYTTSEAFCLQDNMPYVWSLVTVELEDS